MPFNFCLQRTTMTTSYIGTEALAQLVSYCAERSFNRFRLVADQTTYAAWGEAVAQGLQARGWEVNPIILTGAAVVADEHYLMQVLLNTDATEQVWLSVGSGTLTDIVRFVSHRTRSPFIALATAPSMDGYTSSGAPLVIQGVKLTISTRAPQAVFADLPVLQAAPRPMIAAGLGDMLGKFTALADWQLGSLLWDEPYSAAIAAQMRLALERCVEARQAIGEASEAGIQRLMEGLILSGECIAQAGHSRPASGSEHHLSHFWEMRALRAGKPAKLHGAKVGVATTLIAALYARLATVSTAEVRAGLSRAASPDRPSPTARIQAEYGDGAATLLAEQQPFLELSPAQRERILQHWPEVLAIAATVPSPDQLRHWLAEAGAPITPGDLGLTDADVHSALELAHYLRPRFTVLKLFELSGLRP
jgi:glycerol-1-phosphate dehydrogenase [NAD(P)+]